MHESRVISDGDEIAVIFPYIPEQVAAIKRVPGARWDRLAKIWRVPMTSIAEVRVFARKYRFAVDTSLTGFALPEHSIGQRRVELVDGTIRIAFPYDKVKIKAVRELPGAKWDGKTKTWGVPATSVDRVLKFAERFSFSYEDDLNALRDQTQVEFGKRFELSRAEDADISVSGLVGALRPFQRRCPWSMPYSP